ncbi:hypothetical protein ACTU45_23080 [Streptomyces sp. 24-1644]|uniref:hypothetical protein n=1 Tax=Streptomyces sp. 24-1644 TaxID=3457315 RepID=UPI003FA7C7BF
MPILVEAGWGGLVQYPWTITWTDISNRVDMVTGVTITRGAADELSETQPGTASLTLDNSDGALTPGKLTSPFSPFVRRNSPIRISQVVIPSRAGAAPWPLSMLGDDFDDQRTDPTLWTASGGATETDEGRLRLPLVPGVVSRYTSTRQWTLTGAQLTVKLARVPAASGSSAASFSLYLHSATTGTRFRWYYNALGGGELRALSEVGSTDGAPVVLPYSPIDHAWVRIRETAGLVVWETSPDGWGWTVRRSISTPAWVGTDQIQVELAASRTGGTSDPAEVDLLGGLVRPRFWGMVNHWPVRWKGLYSSVSISATDLFKRLNRWPTLRTCLQEEILADAPLAYYPLTEPAGATSAGDQSGTAAGALSITQVGSGGTIAFGATPGPAAAVEPLPVFSPVSTSVGKYLTADLGPDYEGQTTGSWDAAEAWFSTSTPGRVLFAVSSIDATASFRLVFALSAGGSLQIEYGDGIFDSVATGNLADGALHHLVYDEVTREVYIDGALVDVADELPLMYYSRILNVGGFKNSRLWSGTIGYVALYATTGATLGPTLAEHYTAGTTAFAGEAADARITRLARYAGLTSVTVLGSTHDPVAEQGAGGTGVVARMREVEATESGRLYAERDYFGLAYQSRDLRYNPDPDSEVFTISYADLDTDNVELADDDQKMVNSVEASRPGGATQTVTAPASIAVYGTYPQPLNLLKMTDSGVLDAAHWTVSRYADPDPELREVPVEAYTMPAYLDILDADISSYFTVYDLPEESTAAELRVTVEGYTETLKENSHFIQFRTSASSTDSVWVIGDPVYGQLGITTRLAY